MAKIRIVGDSSGYVEIAAPNAAGNNTLELPSSGTRLTAADSSGNLSVSGILTVSAGSTSIPSISPSGDSNTGIFFPSADTIAFGEGGVESARFDSSGRLGIGTANPSEALHVLRASNGNQFAVDNTGQQYSSINLKNNGTRKGVLEWNNTSAVLELAVDGSGSPTGSLAFSTGNTTRMTIDSSGRIKTPNQPAFLAFFSSSSDVTTNSGAVFAFNRTDYNIGSHFDTSTNVGRFTAPVAGIYAFSWAMFFTNSGGNTQGMNVAFLKNGSQYNASSGGTTSDAFQITNTPNSTGGVISNSATYYFNLSANDYIELYARGANIRIYQGHSHFCGYLIG
jgi:hypothetical protein